MSRLQFDHRGAWRVVDGEIAFRSLRDYYGIVPGCDMTVCIAHGMRGVFDVFFLASEVKRSREVTTRQLRDRVALDRILAEADQVAEETEAFGEKLVDLDVSSATDAQLLDLFRESNLHLGRLQAYYRVSNREYSDMAIRGVRNNLGQRAFEQRDVLNCLTAADLTGLRSFEEMEARLRIIREHHDRRRPNLEGMIAHYAKRYGYLILNDNLGTRPNMDACQRILLHASQEDVEALHFRLHDMRYRRKHSEVIAAQCARRLGLSRDDLLACRAIARLSVNRLRLREARQFHYWARRPLMRVILERVEASCGAPLSPHLKRQLSLEEIEEALVDGSCPSQSQLAERFERALIELRNGTIRLRSRGDAAAGAASLGIPKRVSRAEPVLTGTVVCGSGIVEGQALILRPGDVRHTDLDRYRGRIVITNRIGVRIIPACFRAMALITEEGGVTSHAATVAREAGLCCVVDVVGATDTFKEGDWLRVSSETGVIEVVSAEKAPERQAAQRLSVARGKAAEDGALQVFAPLSGGPDLVALDSDAAENHALVGGKAANLHRMRGWTPPGFVITTVGIRHLLAWARCSCTPTVASPEGIEIVNRPRHFPSPPRDLQAAVEEAVRMLNTERLAVRSSYVHEDSSTRSYAGIFQSFTDVDSAAPDALWSAILQVVMSAQGRLLGEYVRVAGRGRCETGMAVLVQRMVTPRVSGVALTSLERRGQEWFLLEYRYGALAPVMSGLVTPQRSAMPRSVYTEVRRTSRFAASLVPPGVEAAIGVRATNRLGSLLAAAEERSDSALEIEWAVDEAYTPWVLQVRPMTGGERHHVTAERYV